MAWIRAPVALSFLLSLSIIPVASAHRASRRASTCNGQSSFCDRSYGNISFVGAHDSYAVSSDNVAANQDYDVTQQLNDGIRMLQVQAHNSSGTIELCHSSCLLFDGGSLETYLGKVKSWMDDNTEDVVTLLIVNSDSFVPSDYDSVFQSAGLTDLSYSPTSANITYSEWPTLGDMIDNGTRLVTFMDYGADYSEVTYIINEFTNMWETAYDVTDTTFDCNVNRTSGDSTNQLYTINHFLDEYDTALFDSLVPDKDDLDQTNAVNGTGSLGLQASTCATQYSRNPNFMLVDFYEYGNGSVFEVAATLNGVEYNPTSAIATPITSTSSSSTSSAFPITIPRGVFAGAATLAAGIAIGTWAII